MDSNIKSALERGGIVDITTTGRRSGKPRRIEIFLHNLDGVLYLTGRPGSQRDWLANLGTHPDMTIHLKRGVAADVPATATVIRDEAARRDLIYRARVEGWKVDPAEARADLDYWVETAPLARVDVAD
ncbi:MAG TPA: nitroreductase/quinone reductase family protein [Acidimicrobiia bacterium]|nr:nitroreductase/quinone reductase family protein [Acidimicrobiia bacterium]